ncbi:lysM and putative peptidoglycan-binding domain-containing protein 2-like isoform X2 [Liolophura sinensis]|uniref:lysM and putative peptidoglycan-binding domain-containing protein 2-like isoform X2 n=1 Tax=Liolophura sinensis TaxID=3198878 RepID=UPI00315845AC
MAASSGNEKQSLGKFMKSQTKYGTTTTVMAKNRCSHYVKHRVVSGDTLARLALKYSVTVEQIKRDNKLWSNESLFLKEHVFIPVTRDNSDTLPEDTVIVGSECFRSQQNSSQKQNSNGDHFQSDAPTDKRTESVSNIDVESSKSDSGRLSKPVSGKESALDFLSKYDSSIAQLKTNVKKMEQNAAAGKSPTEGRSTFNKPREIPALDPGVEQESEC